MSAHGDILRAQDFGAPRAEAADDAQAAFRFAIDGQEFVARETREWRRDCAAASPKHAIGRIVTPSGYYLIFREDLPSTPAAPRPAEILSRRELQVAMLVADGGCDKEIARQLGISAYTVREHIRRIFAKMGVSRRSAIIARMLRR